MCGMSNSDNGILTLSDEALSEELCRYGTVPQKLQKYKKCETLHNIFIY